MKNYYDELEVSKTASKEVINKVYKFLAKKYHPDTTKLDKQIAEEKFKIINEAYEILSDDEKRKKYDLELQRYNPTISYDKYISVVKQRDSLNAALNKLKNNYYKNNSTGYYYTSNYFNTTNSNYQNNIKSNHNHTNMANPHDTQSKQHKNVSKDFVSNAILLILSIFFAIIIINVFLNFFS